MNNIFLILPVALIIIAIVGYFSIFPGIQAVRLEKKLKKQLDEAKEEEAKSKKLAEGRKVEAEKLKKERLLKEAQQTTVAITAQDQQGRVVLNWFYSKKPPAETTINLFIYRSRNHSIGSYQEAQQKAELIVNTKDITKGKYEDSSTRKKGGDFYYTGYVFIDGMSEPITHTVTHIKIDGAYHRGIEAMELETQWVQKEAVLNSSKTESRKAQKGYIESEVDLLDIEDETGILARKPEHRNLILKRQEEQKRRLENKQKQLEAIKFDSQEIVKKITSGAKDKKEAIQGFRDAVLEIKDVHEIAVDEDLLIGSYEALYDEAVKNPLLVSAPLYKIIEELDPRYKEYTNEDLLYQDEPALLENNPNESK